MAAADRSAPRLAVLVALSLSCAGPAGEPAAPVARDFAVADLHIDTVYWRHYRGRSMSLAGADPGAQVSAAALRDGRVRLVVLSLYLDSGLRRPRHVYADFAALLETAESMVNSNRTIFAGEGAVDYLFSVEGAHALAGHEDRIPELVRRGVLLYGLTHALHNQLADSATDPRGPRRPGGLTEGGRAFVRAVYSAGGLVDISHLSDGATADVAAIAREQHKPLIATHSGARAVRDHPRNLTDDQLRAVKRSGGVVGVPFHDKLLRRGGGSSAADVARHIVHIARTIGAAHVAIGSDLDGKITPARGLETHAGLPTLVAALARAGLSDRDIRAILWDNAARVLPRRR